MLDAAQQTLETMYFAVTDSISADPARPSGELIAAHLDFRGSPDGCFALLASEPLACTLTANFFGWEESSDLIPSRITGVVAELTNMICGAALTKIESAARFDLAAPTAIRIAADQPVPEFIPDNAQVCRLEFPEGTLVVFLSFGDKSFGGKSGGEKA